MRTRYLLLFGLVCLPALLAGCGGGGSTTGGAPSGGAASTGTTITGVASKGLIQGGVINIYAPPASGDMSGKILLQSAVTDSAGAFSANLGTYSGIVLIEASGTYTDEATGHSSQIAAASPLRAVVVVTTPGVTLPVAVTPLTELATQRAFTGTVLTAAAVTAANALVSNLFQWDIIATLPVAPGVTALDAATQAQRDYTIALAGISEIAVSAGSPAAVIGSMYGDLSATGRLAPATVTGFLSGVASFLADQAHNQTGITVISPALSQVGQYTGQLYLATQSTGGTVAPITSLQMTLTLPVGVTIKTDATGAPLVSVSGVAAQAAAPGVNFAGGSTLTLAIISSPGFGVGQFATVTYVANPGVIPVASDFHISGSQITGFDGTNDFAIQAAIVAVLP